MEIKFEYDEEGGKFLCDLFTQMLEDKWAAEDTPPEPLYRGTRIFVRAEDLTKDCIVIY